MREIKGKKRNNIDIINNHNNSNANSCSCKRNVSN